MPCAPPCRENPSGALPPVPADMATFTKEIIKAGNGAPVRSPPCTRAPPHTRPAPPACGEGGNAAGKAVLAG